MRKISLSPDTNFGNNEKDGAGNKKECITEIKDENGCGCCSGPDLSFLKTTSSKSTNSKAEQSILEEQEKEMERKGKRKKKGQNSHID